jgi:hypothetical protein
MLRRIYSELNFVRRDSAEVFSCARTFCDSAAGVRVGSAQVVSLFSIRIAAKMALDFILVTKGVSVRALGFGVTMPATGIHFLIETISENSICCIHV